jgi:pimeloyl-ACP methyl ester carboxylesterase
MNLDKGTKDYSISIGPHEIHFVCRYHPGSEEVILFIHGLGCSLDSFSYLFEEGYFPSKSYLLIDLAGFGKSSKLEEFSYCMEDQAKLIEQLLTLLPSWKINIVAHSMGGAIALLFNPNILSRVLTFANIEGNLISDDCGILSRSIILNTYEEYRADLYKKQIIEFAGHRQLRFGESSPYSIYKSAKSLVRWSDSGNLLKRFSNLECRKCYFYGEENLELPVLSMLDFADKYMISKSGHGMMTENPKEFYKKLAGFIYRH